MDADPSGTGLTLTVSDNGSMVFVGNLHGASAAVASCNSVYFGNSSVDDGSASLLVDVGAGGVLHMADPLAMQADGVASGNRTLGDVSLAIEKKGLGTWELAGQNILPGTAEWRINAGTLHLFGKQHGNQPTRIVMDAPGSSFQLASGAHLALTPFPAAMLIKASAITLDTGSTVGLAGHSFGPEVPYGERTILELDAGTLVNHNGVPVTEGSLKIGFYEYQYDHLRWVDVGKRLVVNIADTRVNHDFACVCSVTGPMAAVLADAGNRLVFERAGRRLYGRDAPCERPEDGIWLAGSAAHSDFGSVAGIVGYDLNSYTTVLGLDKRVGGVFLGIAGSYSRPDFKGGHTRFDARGHAGMIYGGATLPLGIEASFLGSFGAIRFNQKRDSEGTWYTSKYDTHVLAGGFGLARRFDATPRFSLSPVATYEYIRMKTQSYRERGGYYALTLAESPQTLHRLNAGVEFAYQTAGCLRLSGKAWYQGVYGDTR